MEASLPIFFHTIHHNIYSQQVLNKYLSIELESIPIDNITDFWWCVWNGCDPLKRKVPKLHFTDASVGY